MSGTTSPTDTQNNKGSYNSYTSGSTEHFSNPESLQALLDKNLEELVLDFGSNASRERKRETSGSQKGTASQITDKNQKFGLKNEIETILETPYQELGGKSYNSSKNKENNPKKLTKQDKRRFSRPSPKSPNHLQQEFYLSNDEQDQEGIQWKGVAIKSSEIQKNEFFLKKETGQEIYSQNFKGQEKVEKLTFLGIADKIYENEDYYGQLNPLFIEEKNGEKFENTENSIGMKFSQFSSFQPQNSIKDQQQNPEQNPKSLFDSLKLENQENSGDAKSSNTLSFEEIANLYKHDENSFEENYDCQGSQESRITSKNQIFKKNTFRKSSNNSNVFKSNSNLDKGPRGGIGGSINKSNSRISKSRTDMSSPTSEITNNSAMLEDRMELLDSEIRREIRQNGAWENDIIENECYNFGEDSHSQSRIEHNLSPSDEFKYPQIENIKLSNDSNLKGKLSPKPRNSNLKRRSEAGISFQELSKISLDHKPNHSIDESCAEMLQNIQQIPSSISNKKISNSSARIGTTQSKVDYLISESNLEPQISTLQTNSIIKLLNVSGRNQTSKDISKLTVGDEQIEKLKSIFENQNTQSDISISMDQQSIKNSRNRKKRGQLDHKSINNYRSGLSSDKNSQKAKQSRERSTSREKKQTGKFQEINFKKGSQKGSIRSRKQPKSPKFDDDESFLMMEDQLSCSEDISEGLRKKFEELKNFKIIEPSPQRLELLHRKGIPDSAYCSKNQKNYQEAEESMVFLERRKVEELEERIRSLQSENSHLKLVQTPPYLRSPTYQEELNADPSLLFDNMAKRFNINPKTFNKRKQEALNGKRKKNGSKKLVKGAGKTKESKIQSKENISPTEISNFKDIVGVYEKNKYSDLYQKKKMYRRKKAVE